MAEGSEDKTEPATPKRRQEAFESGQSPRSQDMTAALLLFAGVLLIKVMGPGFVSGLSNVMRGLLGSSSPANPQDAVGDSMRIAAPHVLWIVVPIFLAMALVAFFATALQVGFRFTMTGLKPSLNKLNPLAGFKRLFGGQNWFQFFMNLLKMAILAGIIYSRVQEQMPIIVSLGEYAFPDNMRMAWSIIIDLALRIASYLLVLAVADWGYHKWKFEKDIRMSKQEIKDESKRSEGDLEVKAKRRAMARKMIMQRIQSDVPRADVIITNPTELAIALKYDPETMSAPRVIAKGSGFLAMRIRQVAAASSVPIVERKPLAQALYKSVEVGQDVPPQFYQAIAEILAYVYELAGRGYRHKKAG
jgi:flagellar biosynthetic protein FlhB